MLGGRSVGRAIVWNYATITALIYYAITNMAAVKMTDEERRYPRSIAWLGLISCLFLSFWVEPTVWATGLRLIAIGLCWWGGRASGNTTE